jgi:hypothetical protein
MPSLRSASLLLALLGAGCSAPVVDDVADASSALTEGVVLVERVVSSDGATQTNISAKFMRLSVASDLEMAERVVGSRLDLPRLGACMRLPVGGAGEQAASLASLATLGPIELVDVGDVNMRVKAPAPISGPAPTVPLALRAFPDVGDIVSGVFYTSPDAASDLPAGEAYVVEASGSSVLDRFSIEASAPSAPEDVRVGGVLLTEGITLEDGVSAPVRWRSRDVARGDLVFIDVSGASGAAVRCAFEDAGEALVPGALLRSAELGGSGAAATLSLHRVRRSSFAPGLAGLDAGEIRFDLSVVGRATLVAHTP